MKINLNKITIRDLVNGYLDESANELAIVGYGGKLNIRPAYQREFVYNPVQRNAVIDSIFKDRPLNVMYWAVNNDSYEIIDGQQRTISIAQYVNGEFSVIYKEANLAFQNLTQEEQEKFLNYELFVYWCEGTDREKLEWFETINVAGEKLNAQELLNSVYTGVWLTNAKKFFSKTNCLAKQLSEKFVDGSPIRQDLLAEALKWVARSQGIDIKEYMSKHQKDSDATELIAYFKEVINWVETYFGFQTTFMKSPDWGNLYFLYGNNKYSVSEIESKVKTLAEDDELQSKKGIYQYVLSNETKWLSFRAFTKNDRETAYAKQKGICPKCGEHFKIEDMEADHIEPWSKGGKTILENCQMLCKLDNARKTDKW